MQVSPFASGSASIGRPHGTAAPTLSSPEIETTSPDELTLSGEGLAAAELFRPEFFPVRDDGIHVEEIRADFAGSISDLQSRLTSLFQERGIATDPPIPLQTGADGAVVVAGEHPQKSEIEALFREDRSLRNDFIATQSQAEFLRAADEATEFQAAYRRDPKAALQAFAHLFEARQDNFTLTFRGEAAEIEFT